MADLGHFRTSCLALVMTTQVSWAQDQEWRRLEAPVLKDHVQLTSRDDFVKAGESYFSPDGKWIVFQAIPVPAAGVEADPYYSMYVAKVRREGSKITGLEKPFQISPPGSANTCGWFHPIQPYRVLFGSTLVRPSSSQKSGFQVGMRKYLWMFPEETEVVSRTVGEIYSEYAAQVEQGRAEIETSLDKIEKQIARLQADVAETDDDSRRIRESAAIERLIGVRDRLRTLIRMTQPMSEPDAAAPKQVFLRPRYDAECSYSKDGRFILYAHVREDEDENARPDADIWVYDTKSGGQHPLVVADGYDGGPFFSPDMKRICYRSDRVGNDLLQLFVADLTFNDDGVPVGITNEWCITGDNGHVNWAPYWYDGLGGERDFLVYATSEMGHTNYEIFATEVPHNWSGGKPDRPLRHRRVTFAGGADVLPAFSHDGHWMIWTAQRGPMFEGETKPSSQVWVARVGDGPEGLQVPKNFFATGGSAPHHAAVSNQQTQPDGDQGKPADRAKPE